eukprot:jgi/Botrbrau1/506/Bobra.110_2s0136.1
MKEHLKMRVPCIESVGLAQSPLWIRPSQRLGHRRSVIAFSAATQTVLKVKDYGTFSVKGSSRKQNEDRLNLLFEDPSGQGEVFGYAAVFDGHGGYATAEWLEQKLSSYLDKNWKGGESPEEAVTEAFLQADRKLMAPTGFAGMGERGVGGSKCGATAAVALLYKGKDGATKLLAANVGDARVLLCRGGKIEQLTVDHVPDSEEERLRIERQNPNPKLPLVRYVGGTWRTGGILALSRAFGDAYMKGSYQFEGVAAGSSYSSGFGVIAEPDITITDLKDEDSWIIISSDGLYANTERGGGGGFENDGVGAVLAKEGGKGPKEVAQTLALQAQKLGSTDDVTVIAIRLGA